MGAAVFMFAVGPKLLHSLPSLMVHVGQLVADSRRSGTPHKRGFLCAGNERSWPEMLVS